MTSSSKATTPTRPSGFQSRSRHLVKDGAADEPCPEGTPRCLCREVAKLYDSGRLKLYRGTVSRQRLEDELGLGRNTVASRARATPHLAPGRCLRRFDQLLESWGHGTVWTERIPAIRQVLEARKAAGTLPVNEQGDLNRTAILREFGLRDGKVHVAQQRSPKLRALLDAYDTTRDDPAYTPYQYEALAPRVTELLARTDLKLTHGRIISKQWLGKQLGVQTFVLSYTPRLNGLIEEKQREIDRQIQRGRTTTSFRIGKTDYINLGATPHSEVHKRIFDFSELVPHYGLEFAEKVGTLFIAVTGRLASPSSAYHRIKHFLGWLANRPSGDIAERLRCGEGVEQAPFERATLVYKAELTHGGADGEPLRTPKNPAISIIEKFGGAGLFPSVQIPRLGKQRRNRTNTPRPSLVEAHAVNSDTQAILESSQYRDIEFSAGKDAIAFAETLALERARRDDLPGSLSEAMRILCEERLVELRRAASLVFEGWRTKYEAGRKLIESADANGEEIFNRLKEGRRGGVHNQRWKRLVTATFPNAEPERALGNLLALIEAKFQGICPLGTGAEWGSFWIAQYRKMGGGPEIQSHLLPPALVASAIAILYLCESGTNSEVALGMRQSAIRKSTTPRHLSVVGRKARAGNRPIFSDLPIRNTQPGCTSAAEALRFYRDAVRNSRPTDRDTPLFSYASRSRLRTLEEWQLRKDLQTIRTGSERLESLDIVPSMIRPTVLLALQLRHPANPGIPQALAQHRSDTTTMGYVNKLPYRLILEERIRMFTDTIEVIISDQTTWKSTGRTRGQWKKALETAQRTGLGVWCTDPRAGAQGDFPEGTTCQAVDRCLTCAKILVVADKESVADMIVWRQALKAAEHAWLDDRTTRWEHQWVPWQAFFQVVLDEKMARGELLVIRKEGEEEAKQRMASPSFVLPQPW